MANEEHQSQMTARSLWGVPLTALLMSAFVLVLYFAYTEAPNLPSFPYPYFSWMFNLLIIGTASGGAMGVRIARLRWDEVAAAALLSEAGLIVFSSYSTVLSILPDPFLFSYIPGGVFLLPLLDPAVREKGPTLSFGRVAPIAFVLSFLIAVSALLALSLPGLAILSGLLLSLSREPNYERVGAWVGGLAVLVLLFVPILILFFGYN